MNLPILRIAADHLARSLRGNSLGDQIRRNALLISTTTLVLSLISCFVLVRHYALKHLEAEFRAQADIRATRLEANMDERLHALLDLSRNPLITNALSDTQDREAYVNPYLKELTRNNVGFTQINLIDLRGRVLAGSDTSPVPADVRLGAASLANLEAGRQLAHIETSPDTHLVIAMPVVFNPTSSVEGALVARIALMPLLEHSLLYGDEPIAFALTDNQGREVALVDKYKHGAAQMRVVHPLQVQSPLMELNLSAVTTLDGREVIAITEWLSIAFLLAGSVALAITHAIASKLARSISEPVARLSEVARRMASEGRAEGGTIPQVGHGEVASLADALGKMADSLARSNQELEDKVSARTREWQDANAMLDRVLYSARDAIWEYSLETRKLVFMSEGARQITGVAPERLLQRPWYMLILREDRHRFMQALIALSSGQSQVEINCGIDRPDGEVRILHHRMQASFSHDGQLMKIAGTSTDITEKLERESEFRQHAERLESIFSLSPDGYAIVDEEGKITSANATFREIAELGPEDIGAITLDQLIRNLEARANPEEGFPDFGHSGIHGAEENPTADHPSNGQLVHLKTPKERVLQVAMREGPTRTVAKVLYFRDITREAEVDRMKSEFLSTAAHELRTPMSSVLGFSQLLMTRELDPEIRKEIYGTIYEQSTRLAGLLDELLDLARIEARGGKDFRIVPTQLQAIVEKTVAGILIPGDQRKVSVLPPPDWPVVNVDPDKFQQALTNVISNAYKYSPDGGEISLRVLSVDSQIMLEVEDHGIGMTPAQLRRAFERFYRADTTGNIPGTGLGLSLVKEIMELHGGSCRIVSEPGQKTVVSLILPAAGLTSQTGHSATAMDEGIGS